MFNKLITCVVSVALVVVVMLAFAHRALAATLIVTKLADTNDGSCDLVDCSLREAIAAAASGDTITFSGGLSGTITLGSELVINKHLTFTGPTTTITVSGNNAVPIFNVASGTNLTLNNLTIANGRGSSTIASAIYAPWSGSGTGTVLTLNNTIFNHNTAPSVSAIYIHAGRLVVNNSTFSNNVCNCAGGVIYLDANLDGLASISNSTFSNNAADVDGGAIVNFNSALTINNSSFTGNSAGRGGAIITAYAGGITVNGSTFTNNSATNGGAIYNATGLTINDSTITTNTSSADGGGIYNAASGNATVTGSTISGNNTYHRNGNGGGILNSGAVTLVNSTIAGNDAHVGVGIHNSGSVTIINTTIANNSGDAERGIRNYGTVTLKNTIMANIDNCIGGTFVDGGNNLQYFDSTCGGSIPTADPKLGPLQDNGGGTLTMALLSGSPAIDAGSNTVCAAAPVDNVDQRGVSRPIDGNGDNNAVCDIGAYEAPAVQFSSATYLGGSGDQLGFGLTISGPALYAVGYSGTSAGLTARFTLPNLTAVWSATLTSTTNFYATGLISDTLLVSGGALPPACGASDGSGDTEGKSLLARYTPAGALVGCGSTNFFNYRGGEGYRAGAAAVDNGLPVFYAAGSGENRGFGNYVLVLVKYDAAGAILQNATEPGVVFGSGGSAIGASSGNGLAAHNGYLYVAGASALTGLGEDNVLRPALMQYDLGLTRQWKQRVADMAGQFTAVAGQGTAVYAVGYRETTPGTESTRDYVIQKYTTGGTLVWSRVWGGSAADALNGVTVIGNRVFVAGYTRSQGAGGADAVLMEIDPATGDVLSTQLFGGAQDELANSLATDGADLYVVGEARSYASAAGNLVGQSDLMLLRYTIGPVVRFSAAGESVAENSGSAVITATLSSASGLTVTVAYATSDGTATAGSDYTASSGTLTFNPGQITQTFSVSITNDTLDETNETVMLTLSGPSNATLGNPNPATLTILDDDPAPTVQFSAATYSVSEATGSATITATLNAASGLTVTVAYTTSNGTASAGSDYTAASGTLTFNPGQITQTFSVSITNDTLDETNETVTLTLGSPSNAILGTPNPATLTILDDDPAPAVAFSAAAYSVNENGGSATITATLTAASGLTVTVNYTTSNGTAIAGSDYLTASGVLTFTPGQTSRTFTVVITDDALVEPNETVTLTLSSPSNATLGSPNPATLTIVENDVLTAQFSNAAYSVSENGGSALITITLNMAASYPVSVNYATSNGTAIAGSDYLTTSGVLTFAPGVVTRTFAVTITDDVLVEPNETVTLTLSSPVSATLGSPNPATLTIVENDALPNAFGKSTPTNGATGQPVTPTLSWGSSSGATSYEYCYNTTPACPGESWTNVGASASVGLSGLDDNTTYYWQVRARNASGVTEANGGTWWSFTATLTCPSPNNVGGTITTHTTWYRQCSPYIVTANVGVAPGVTLTIRPGVEVRFNGNYNLNVGGALIADGTESQPVRFISHTGGAWGRIYFDNSSADAVTDLSGAYQGGNILRWAQIENAGQGLACNNATPYLAHVTTTGGGINCTAGSTRLWLAVSDVTGDVTIGSSAVPEEIGSWTTRANMPTARSSLGVAAASNGKIYAIGGYNGGILTTVEEYDPATNTWATRANMPTARYNLGVAAASNGKIYAIGGYNGGGILATVEEYDPATNTWVTRANMPTARYNLGVAAASNGKIYAIGGAYSDYGSYLATVEEYDPATNTWTTRANMPTARDRLGVAATSDGKIYAIGGASNVSLATVEEYDPATNTWTTRANMLTERNSLGVTAAANGKLYAIGGQMDTVEEYDLATNTWTTRANLLTQQWSMGVAAASNGKIYVIGGWYYYSGGYLATVEEFTLPVAEFAYSVQNTTLRGGNLNMPYASQVLTSAIGGSITTGRDSTVQNTTAAGNITINGCGKAENNVVNGGGISISRDGTAMSNTITGGGISISRDGTVLSNTVNGGGISISRDGTVLSNTVNGGEISISRDGTAMSNTVTGGGISISSGAVLSNTVTGGGISVGSDSLVQGNNVENSGGWGISAGGSVTLLHNRVVGPANGVNLAGGGLAQGNLIANASGVGLEVSGSVTVISNTLTGNQGHAIVIDSGAPTIHGNNLEFNTGAYDLVNNSASAINAGGNWWGTTSSAVINGRVYDFSDDYLLGVVTYSPVLTGPAQDAPAYARAVTLTPPQSMGNETVTFDVLFSREMNPASGAAVKFYTDGAEYPVTNNPQWLASNLYRASYTFTTLIPRGVYSVAVSSARGSDGIQIAPYVNHTFIVDYPSVQLTSSTYTVTEGTGSATITVTLSAMSSLPVTIAYNTADGTATAGKDYTAISGTLTFNPGQTTRTFSVSITNDTLNETNETVMLALSNPFNATLSTPDSATLTILDNDPAPAVQFSAANYSVNENGGSATITATLSAASGLTVTVDYATSDGTASADSDYTATSGTLTFAPGVTTHTFTVSITNDTLYEANKTVLLTLSSPISATLGSPNPATLTIINTTPPPTMQFSAATYGVNENGGSATITVTLSSASGLTATVAYATSNGTAIAGSDYLAASGVLTFAPGQTSRTFTVVITDDAVVESNETVMLALSGAVSATLGTPNPATLTIVDNDAPTVQFSSAVYNVSESAGSATITVTLSTASVFTVSVAYATSNGTAVAGSDYLTASGVLTFAPGQTSRVFTVVISDDVAVEPNETVLLTLSSPVSATLGSPNPATLTIVDDGTAPIVQFSVANYIVNESGGSATITATLNAASGLTVTVAYATSNGTATAGSDYLAVSGVLTFAPGQTSRTFTVVITDDTLVEPNETVTLTLSSPSNATLGTPNPATLTIVDNDAPTVQFSSAVYNVSENAGSATITVTLSTASVFTVSVAYATNNGTAVAGSDYVATSGVLTFAPGQTSRTFTVVISDDEAVEPNETVILTLSNPSSATLGSPNPATLTILDNDAAPAIIYLPIIVKPRPPYDGDWLGTTSQGEDIFFEVNNNMITYLDYKIRISGNCNFEYFGGTAESLAGNAFSFTEQGQGYSYTINGTFNSTMAASGSLQVTSQGCGGSANVTWSAAKQ